ncbi:MarR family winged helix-turn-helix transcriptional regulator [Arthrobacter sp. GCM10027362]|uniref:MarR family winged helix-turn-helix transcriptional regulator n=1 Tax=Arthrobacter sp. GCM10027362 TaxID=3273379 RepID=UPI003639744A
MNSDTRWLDEHEQQIWRALRELIWGFESAMDRQLIRDSELSGVEYSVLAALSETEGGTLRARDLAHTLDWERSRLSHLLKRMEARGLVARTECPEDARGFDISMTAAGRTAIEKAAPGHVSFVREHVFDSLTPAEQEALLSATTKIQNSLRAAGWWERTGKGG